MARKLRKGVKVFLWLIVIALLIYGNYRYDWIKINSGEDINAEVLATYNDVKYTSVDLDRDFKLFSAAYATDILDVNITRADILNSSVYNDMIYVEALVSDYNESFVQEYADYKKDTYLQQNLIDNATYKANYEALGFTEKDIDNFFYEEALISYYVENEVLQVEVSTDDVIANYESNLDAYTYDDNFLIFKMILVDNESIADDLHELALNYADNFDLTDATQQDIFDAKNYWFSYLINAYSLDVNKDYTNGLYVIDAEAEDEADILIFMENAVEDLDEYGISNVKSFEQEAIDENNQTVEISSYYIFEKLPNTLPLIDVFDDIQSQMYEEQRSMVWNLYMEGLKQRTELKFY